MTNTKKKDRREKTGEYPEEKESISTLRDILFGAKTAEFEKRFDALEKYLNQEIANMREEMNKLFHSLEDFFKEEIKSLNGRLKEEQEDRENAEKNIRDDMDKLSKKVSTHKEENADAHRELRQLILDRQKELSRDVQQMKKELQTLLEEKIDALEEKKTDRVALADMLSEIAAQLGKTPSNPPAGE